MAKTKISEYSSTSAGANLNTDINTIDIDEGCAPSGINNAIRTLMAQLKDFQTGVSGDGLTLGGALSGTSATFSGNVTASAISGASLTLSGNVTASAISGASMTLSGDLTVDTNTLYVDSTNNRVGIGTSSPSHNLQVYSASNPEMRLGDATVTYQLYTDGSTAAITGTVGSHALVYRTNATERMRIDSSGTAIIGGTSASAAGSKLELKTATNTANVLYMLKAAQVEVTMGFKSSTDTNFYIGTGSSTIGTYGVYLANTGNSWISVSDERKKTVVEPITNASEKVSSLRTVIGYFNNDENQTHRPFLIAQDVQAVLPEAVNVQQDDDNTLGLSYTDVIPLLTAALKEVITKIDALEAKVAALESN